ncbi:hypothetical protein DPMN_073123 [Dreissena polymorpha]|uniref:Uncharacterized protein n=1 Tax=Dreissena polymorpha TaxID=45954 RepID=A0A9D4BYH8_DREPO|nr:hypothetical protein DPMN_073123 [Dreissena polymorpha]
MYQCHHCGPSNMRLLSGGVLLPKVLLRYKDRDINNGICFSGMTMLECTGIILKNTPRNNPRNTSRIILKNNPINTSRVQKRSSFAAYGHILLHVSVMSKNVFQPKTKQSRGWQNVSPMEIKRQNASRNELIERPHLNGARRKCDSDSTMESATSEQSGTLTTLDSSLRKPPDIGDVWTIESIGIIDDPSRNNDEVAMQKFKETLKFENVQDTGDTSFQSTLHLGLTSHAKDELVAISGL